MIYLLLSILCSTSIIIIFKLYDKFKVRTFDAIVFNYLVAATLGYSTMPIGKEFLEGVTGFSPWFVSALFLGVLFIVLFNVMGTSAQKVGITWTAIANNMSVIIPVILAVILYGDAMPFIKITGIALALLGIYLSTKPNKAAPINKQFLYLPILLFVGSGIISSTINFTEKKLIDSGDSSNQFITTIFANAGGIGIVVLVWNGIKHKRWPSLKSLVAGLVLGIPNYGSIYFLFHGLDSEIMESSEFFPVNNMSIVALSAVLAMAFFKERLTKINWIGIAVCIFAIAIITFHARIVAIFL